MSKQDLPLCRWCGEPMEAPKPGQKFCRPNHRYQFHKFQRIAPGQLDQKVREIVRDELAKLNRGAPITSA